jgi:cellobiose phosphorylase
MKDYILQGELEQQLDELLWDIKTIRVQGSESDGYYFALGLESTADSILKIIKELSGTSFDERLNERIRLARIENDII